MLNILIAEGTPAVWQAERAGFGLPSNFSLVAAAVQLHQPGAHCVPVAGIFHPRRRTRLHAARAYRTAGARGGEVAGIGPAAAGAGIAALRTSGSTNSTHQPGALKTE